MNFVYACKVEIVEKKVEFMRLGVHKRTKYVFTEKVEYPLFSSFIQIIVSIIYVNIITSFFVDSWMMFEYI